MQRFSFGILILSALYFSASANATQDQSIVSHAASSVQSAPIIILSNSAPELSAPVGENSAPHIALLLPLKSKSSALARAAEVVEQGFTAAASVQHGIPVRVYPCIDESKDVISVYKQALANGALAVAGPLTRDGVTTLANYSGINVPTLALNATEVPKNSSEILIAHELITKL